MLAIGREGEKKLELFSDLTRSVLSRLQTGDFIELLLDLQRGGAAILQAKQSSLPVTSAHILKMTQRTQHSSGRG